MLKKTIEYGLYLLVFLLPWQTRWIIRGGEIEYSRISLYGVDILLLVLVGLFIVYQLRIKDKALIPEFSRVKPGTTKWWLVGFLELIIFVSIFFASDKILALYRYGVFLLGVGFFWLIVAFKYDRVKFVRSLLVGILLQACLGIWQFLMQSSFANKWLGMALHNPSELGVSVIETIGPDGIRERWLRAYGGMEHPNVLGGMLVVGVLLLVSLLFQKKFSISNFQFSKNFQFLIFNFQGLIYVFFVIFIMAIFFTFSRGAWISVSGGVILMLFWSVFRKDLWVQKNVLQIILVSIILAAVLYSQFGNLVITRLTKDSRLEIMSSQERIASFKDAKELIKENAFTGIGIGNYSLAMSKHAPERQAWEYQPVHNVFLLVWAEVGILGLLGFLGLLGYLGWTCIRKKNIIGLSLLLALVIMMSVDHWFWSLHFGVIFTWLVFGLILSNPQINKSAHKFTNTN